MNDVCQVRMGFLTYFKEDDEDQSTKDSSDHFMFAMKGGLRNVHKKNQLFYY